MELNQVTLPSADIARSVDFYRRLGFTLIVDTPHYARFACPVGGATFSLHRVESGVASHGVVVYFECDQLDQLVADLETAGIAFCQPPTDQRWLWREARLKDPDGNELCLYFAGINRLDPPWRVPRGDS